jgi:hypothetical protein
MKILLRMLIFLITSLIDHKGYCVTYVQDLDDDGMPDDWEIIHSLNPTDPKDAMFDTDNDQVINLFEYGLGSDPLSIMSPNVINAYIGMNIGSAIAATSTPTVIRFFGGNWNVNYNGYAARSVMLQGGWDASFNIRDFNNPTYFNGQHASEIIALNWISGNGAFILDNIHLINGNGDNGSIKFLIHQSAHAFLGLENCSVTQSSSMTTYGGAINVLSWDSSMTDVSLINCLIADCQSTAISSHTTETAYSKCRLINNTITHNYNTTVNCYGVDGFTLDDGVLKINFINTIIYNNQDEAIALSAHAGGTINASSSFSDFDILSIDASVSYSPGPGLISVDPLFISPGADYHLQPGSACIDSGTDIGIDFTGASPDIGVYEFGLSTSITDIIRTGFFLINNITNDNLFIQNLYSLNFDYQIFNLEGILMNCGHLTPSAKFITAQNLCSGIYFLKMNSEVFRFIKL